MPTLLTSLDTNRFATAQDTEFNGVNPSRQPGRIRSSDEPVVDPNQAASLFARYALASRQVRRPQIRAGHETGDVENPRQGATAPPKCPSQNQLIMLRDELTSEERREIDLDKKAQFFALQQEMLAEKDFTRMPEARQLLIDMHHLQQADLDRGFERGGAVYSYRNIAGSIISFMPLMLTYVRTQPEYVKDLGFQVKMSAAYFASVLLTACAGVACNARVLLHCTPIQDAEFDGSPYVLRELGADITPSHNDIKKELDKARDEIDQLNNAVTELQNSDHTKFDGNLKNVLDRLAGIDKNKGIQHYLGRAQLHRVYIEGLQRQSLLQTSKVYGNLAAGWASFLTKNARLGMKVQFYVGMAQIIGQRIVAPADQKQLQNNLFELEIMSRPLSGTDHHADDEIIRGMLRTPREVRVNNLETLFTSYVDTLAQQIAGLAGTDVAEYKKYRRLVQQQIDTAEFKKLKAQVDSKRMLPGDANGCDKLNGCVNVNFQRPENDSFSGLLIEVQRVTQFDLNSIGQLVDLERRLVRNTLTDEELNQLVQLKQDFGDKILGLSPQDRIAFFESGKLSLALTQAHKRRSPRHLAFDSELLSATFNTLSTHFSNEEILAEIIVEVAIRREAIPESMHVSGGRIAARVIPTDAGASAPTSEKVGTFLSLTQLDDRLNASNGELKALQDNLNRLNDMLNDGANNVLLFSDGAWRSEVERQVKKLDGIAANLDSASIQKMWGFAGLEVALMQATREKNYSREEYLCRKVGEHLGVSIKIYTDYHQLRMLDEVNALLDLSQDESKMVMHCKETIEALYDKPSNEDSLQSAPTGLKSLEIKYAEIESDCRYIRERRFEKVSNYSKKLVFDGMQVTRNESRFAPKIETGMLLKEGLRRSGNAPEYMATYGAGMWRAFQLGVTGVNGPLILTAVVGMCEQLYKTTLDDPHAFKSPYWPKILTTAISAAALLANIQATHRIAEAKASPLPWNLKLQKLCGGTGSIAETALQVAKLDLRQNYRDEKTLSGEPRYGEIGILRIAYRYAWETIKTGARLSDGLAVLLSGGSRAKATRMAFEARVAKIPELTTHREVIGTLLQQTANAVTPSAS